MDASPLQRRRERVFLILAGIFLGAMAMLNILGITKFIHLGPFELAVGVLPYPLTFLCTDFISELYGRARANFVVFVGLIINLLVLGFIWIGDAAPPMEFRTPEQRIVTMDYLNVTDAADNPILDAEGNTITRPAFRDAEGDLQPVERVELRPIDPADPRAMQLVDADTGTPIIREETLFGRIATTTRQAVLASMIAYMFAQFVDVWLFHFWKRLTRGRMLWLRNNGSTLISQLVDTTCVVTITFWGAITAGDMAVSTVLGLIGGGYLFKMIVALVDTIPFYIGVHWLRRYLQVEDHHD